MQKHAEAGRECPCRRTCDGASDGLVLLSPDFSLHTVTNDDEFTAKIYWSVQHCPEARKCSIPPIHCSEALGSLGLCLFRGIPQKRVPGSTCIRRYECPDVLPITGEVCGVAGLERASVWFFQAERFLWRKSGECSPPGVNWAWSDMLLPFHNSPQTQSRFDLVTPKTQPYDGVSSCFQCWLETGTEEMTHHDYPLSDK
jgi:hypothetical protein